MLVTSYQSVKDENKFLFVPYGTDIKRLEFPMELDSDYLKITYFKTFEVESDDKRTGMNSAEVLEQIKKQGYATQLSKISLLDRILG